MSLDFNDKTERRQQTERRTYWLEERVRSLDAKTAPTEYENGLRDAYFNVLFQSNKDTPIRARVPIG